MTVGQLIYRLRQFDSKLQVCRSGYEGGFAFVYELEKLELLLDCNTAWYYGPHERAGEWEMGRYPGRERIEAVYVK